MSVCQKLSRPDGNFVPIKQSDMRLIDFMQVFPDEESCGRKLREYREAQGVVCPHCGGKEHYWKGDKKCFECKRCHYRQGLKANTVMHGSQLPLRYWFITMHLLTSTKKSFSTEAPDSEKDLHKVNKSHVLLIPRRTSRSNGGMAARRKPKSWYWRRRPKALQPRNQTSPPRSSTSR